MERQCQPALVLERYVDVYAFLLDIATHLKRPVVAAFWKEVTDGTITYQLSLHSGIIPSPLLAETPHEGTPTANAAHGPS
jgi:hypothetical protein